LGSFHPASCTDAMDRGATEQAPNIGGLRQSRTSLIRGTDKGTSLISNQ
jgi:hypothetical protein